MRTSRAVAIGGLVVTLATPAAAQRWSDDTATTIGTTAEWTNKVELADVDGDGWLDVILANGRSYSTPGAPEPSRVFRNRADWAGTPPYFEEITPAVFGTAVGHARVVKARDIDGDGDDDLFVGNTYGDPSRLYRRDAGGWTDVTAAQLPAGTPWVGDADFGDVDGDGDLDLVLADWGPSIATGAPPRLYLNDAAGTFTDATIPRMPTTLVEWSWELDLADVDGDFDLDLLVAAKNGTGSFLYVNDGTGTFTDVSPGQLPQFGNNYETELMDIDRDGDLDLVTLNDGTSLRDHVFENDGAGTFTDVSATALAGTANPQADDNQAAFLDVDSDGDADLLIGRLGPQGDRLLINDGTGAFTVESGAVPGATPGTLGIAVGDLDGDRRLDLVMGQGEQAFADHVYRATGAVPADTMPPEILLQQIFPTDDVVAARVHDRKSPAGRLDLSAVTLEYSGDATATVPMQWYGEFLWRADLPAPGSYTYRVCATDAAGNAGCSSPKVTTAGGDDIYAPNDAVMPPSPDASGPGIDDGGGGCCQTGASPDAGLLVLPVFGVLARRRRRRPS
jgi:MYXO-CTERM domain-containing protein